MTELINGNAVIPVKKSHIVSTHRDNEPELYIQVWRVRGP